MKNTINSTIKKNSAIKELAKKMIRKNLSFKDFLEQKKEIPPKLSVEIDAETEKRLKIAFKPNEKIEKSRKKRLQQRKATFNITFPPDDTICVNNLTLKLSEIPPTKTAIIYIQNDQEEVIEEQTISCDSLEISFPLDNYAPGLYYWKFCVDKDDIMGRIIICNPIYASFLNNNRTIEY